MAALGSQATVPGLSHGAGRNSFKPSDHFDDTRGSGRDERYSSMRDSAHASREGRQFRVGNIGNNGLLYLRPVGRQHKAQASTSTTYSPTTETRDQPTPDLTWRDSIHSGTGTFQSTGSRNSIMGVADRSTYATGTRNERKRSRSFSNSKDNTFQPRPELGTFKVVVDRASVRNKEQDATSAPQLLEVQIPHYRLGRPKFGRTGSAALQSSLYSSEADQPNSPGRSRNAFGGPSRGLEFLNTSIGSSYGSSTTEQLALSPIQRRTISSELLPLGVPRSPETTHASVHYSQTPAQDRSAVMRVSASGQLTAATPTILINQITSPTNLDYDLLSDFFLTFRFYTTANSILSSLLARLSSAMSSTQECGRVVRVRAFVALRHWVLNYFIDDFVPDFALRLRLCDAVNNISHELVGRQDGGGGDLNIMGELKKCWRRTCSLYWDVPEHRLEGAGDDIMPGGTIGSRSSSLGGDRGEAHGLEEITTLQPDDPMAKETPWIIPTKYDVPASKQHQQPQEQRASIQSVHIVSCSIPVPQRFKAPPSSYGPRPVANRRSGSFSDALRDDRAPLPVPKTSHEEPLPIFQPIPGALIRGAIVQPSRAQVENIAPPSPAEELASFEFNYPNSDGSMDGGEHINGATNPAVRKLFGTMRRALSARQPRSQSATRNSPDRIQRRLSNGASARPTRTPSPRGVAKRKLYAGRTLVRSDALCARAGESFEQAVREDLEAQRIQSHRHPSNDSVQAGLNGLQPPPFTHSATDDARAQSNVTMGSRSIVIVDDTGDKTPTLSNFPAMGTARGQTSSTSPKPAGQQVPLSLGLATDPTALEKLNQRASTARTDELQESTPRASHFIRPSESTLQTSETGPLFDDVSMEKGPQQQIEGVGEPLTFANLQNRSAQDQPPSSYAGETAVTEDSNSAADVLFKDHIPKQTLRRRPGGDLRVADHVHDLQEDSLTDSYGSYQGDVLTATAAPLRINTQTTQTHTQIPSSHLQPTSAPQKSISIIDTHSSQPNMRPSFEKEVAKLANLPDSPEDGGIESALQKLEGRFSDSQDILVAPTSSKAAEADEYDLSIDPDAAEAFSLRNEESSQNRAASEQAAFITFNNAQGYTSETHVIAGPTQTDPTSYNLPQPAGVRATAISVVPTEKSSTSVQALDHDTYQLQRERSNSSSDWLEVSLPRSQDSNLSKSRADQQIPSLPANNSDQSLEVVEATESIRQIPPGATMPSTSPQPHESFLLDDNQSLGSESDNEDNARGTITSFYEEDHDAVEAKLVRPSTSRGVGTTSHPVRDTEIGLAMTTAEQSNFYEHDLHPFRRNPPSHPRLDTSSRGPPVKSKSAGELRRDREQNTHPPQAAHLPFILEYKSSVIAQQMTLIEKDALCEIDWRELIELRWKHSACPIRNWVDFLKANRGPADKPLRNGVDLCIARFNLVVRWALSEIMLTQDLHERAACLVKYIHIAQHSRILRNWATMYQITTALVSADCSRLKQTWSLVPEKEIQALKTLESLIMPMRNFNNLRAEMEAALAADADTETNGACIPFIGIYTHDLIYNAQKPPFISGYDGRDGGEPLVNFERHHTAATIAKSLLQMLEASMRYPFQPVPEVISRCLWMAAIPDEEITRRSRQLEP